MRPSIAPFTRTAQSHDKQTESQARNSIQKFSQLNPIVCSVNVVD